MSDLRKEEIPAVNSAPYLEREATSVDVKMLNHQDDEMSVDSVPHEEEMPITSTLPSEQEDKISTIPGGSLNDKNRSDTTSTVPVNQEEEEVPIFLHGKSVNQTEESSAMASTSQSFNLRAMIDALVSEALAPPSDEDASLTLEFADEENDVMAQIRTQVAEARAAQEEETNHQEAEADDTDLDDFFPHHVTVVEAQLLSQLEISTENRLNTLSILEHLVDRVAADNCAPNLLEIEHNVDTYAYVKLLKRKKSSNADDEDDSPETIAPHAACARCQHDPATNEPARTLLSCGNCRAVQYCSVECQIRDWKTHKNVYCVNPINIPVDMLAKPHKASFLRTTVPKPFARLAKGIWLHDRHKQDVYALLIDSFRLREYDDYTLAGSSNADSVYSGRPSSSPAFRRFLYQAEAKGLMPPWWKDDKRVECLMKGADRSADNYHDLHTMARDVEVVVVYEAAIMAMQLRMFAETVLGSGPAGTDGRLMLQHMVVIEEAARDIVAKEARAAKEAEE